MSNRDYKKLLPFRRDNYMVNENHCKCSWLKYLVFLFIFVPDVTILMKAACVAILFAVVVYLEKVL